jgi:hypothetical protein
MPHNTIAAPTRTRLKTAHYADRWNEVPNANKAAETAGTRSSRPPGVSANALARAANGNAAARCHSGSIYWEGGVDLLWFGMMRPSYFSCARRGGLSPD